MKSLESINRLIEEQRRQNRLIANSFSGVFEAYNRNILTAVEKAMRPAISMQLELDRAFKSILPLLDISIPTDLLEKAEQDFDKFKIILIEVGFPPFEFDLSFAQISQLVNIYYEDGRQAFKREFHRYVMKTFTNNAIDTLHTNWAESGLINKTRLRIIDEIIFCHKNRKYFSSVATIIPQIEWLVLRSRRNKGWATQGKLKEYINELADKESTFSLDEVLTSFFEDVLYTRFEIGKKLPQLSRNAILHGADARYGTKLNSIKCILLFDFLVQKLKDRL